jgi:potassium-transporting ATPase KdpC subunit
MREHIRPALTLLAVFSVLTGVVYPFAVTGIAQATLPQQAGGSLIVDHGQVRGSTLIGQGFTQPGYFHGRPSATTDTDPADSSKTISAPYNAANSVGSNYGPTSLALKDRIKADLAALKAENPDQPVPPELVYASASGLDPDISPTAAAYQVARVAKARALPAADVQALVDTLTRARALGLLGEPTVNVLALNRALDEKKPLPAVTPAATPASTPTTTP